jgi:RsiW-degrading membrane proteinase PrsW (M82 family)
MPFFDYLSYLFSPFLFVLFLAYLRFKFKIRVWKFILLAFIWGMIAVVLVIAANEIIKIWGLENLRNMRRTAFYVFVVVAFSAELGKYLALRYLFYHQKSFDSPLAGIVYATSIALGFSLVAVILYSYGFIGTEKMRYMTLFLWTYPLANIIFGTVQGFFLGMGKVRRFTIIDEGTALGTATVFHALFFFCFLTSDLRLFVITAIGLIVVEFLLVLKAANIHPLNE